MVKEIDGSLGGGQPRSQACMQQTFKPRNLGVFLLFQNLKPPQKESFDSCEDDHRVFLGKGDEKVDLIYSDMNP